MTPARIADPRSGRIPGPLSAKAGPVVQLLARRPATAGPA